MGEWGPVFHETRSRSNFRPIAVYIARIRITTIIGLILDYYKDCLLVTIFLCV